MWPTLRCYLKIQDKRAAHASDRFKGISGPPVVLSPTPFALRPSRAECALLMWLSILEIRPFDPSRTRQVTYDVIFTTMVYH